MASNDTGLSAAEQAVVDAEDAQWGHWTANGPVFIDGVLAFVAGHDVPVQHVEKYHLDEQGLVRPSDQAAPETPAPAYVEPPTGQTIDGDPAAEQQ